MNNDIKLTSDVLAALESGHKIEAIKLLKVSAGLGLIESKEFIEQYIASQPALKEKFDAQKITINFSQQQFLNILIVAVGLMLAYWLFWY
jgi:ribosomal protein L7/L12